MVALPPGAMSAYDLSRHREVGRFRSNTGLAARAEWARMTHSRSSTFLR